MRRGQDINGISATRASAILGLNQWKTPLLAWQEIMEKLQPGFNEKHGYIIPEREDKAVFRWGLAFESAVVKLAESIHGQEIEGREDLAHDIPLITGKIPKIPPAFCFIDGRYGNPRSSERLVLHEGKTTNDRAFGMKWGKPGTDKVPQEIQVQVQHQMMCTGADEVIVSVLVFPRPVDDFEAEGWSVHYDDLNGVHFMSRQAEDHITIDPYNWAKSLDQMGYFHQYPIQAKPDVQLLLRELYNDFWTKYVLTETAPDIIDYEDVRRLFTAPKGTLVVGKKIASMMREYKDITKEIGNSGHLANRKVQIKTDVLKFAREKTTVADDESQEKIVFYDESGNKVGSFDGKTFRS